MTNGDWPEFHQELGRKTMTALDMWSKYYNAGKITKREYYLIVSVLYDTTVGLIEKGFSDLIADIHADLRRPTDPEASRKTA